MNAKKVLVTGFLSGVVIFVVMMAVGFIVQLFLPYDIMSLEGMRAMDDPMMLLFLLHPWVISFPMALIYDYAGKSFQGSAVEKGVKYGLLVWLVSRLPDAFIVYTSMNYPLGFTVNSLVGTLAYVLAAGVVTAKLMEK